MKFMGNAPTCGYNWLFEHNSDLTIYYDPDSTGFTSPTWEGVNTASLSESSDSSLDSTLIIAAIIGVILLVVVIFMIWRAKGRKGK
jgi:hypothetical protein